MLTHKVLTREDAGRTASYYGDGADDYYAKEGNAMEWQGKGADDLGLSGPVDKQRFRELLSGNIGEGQRINRPTKSDTGTRKVRTGIDLTFSAPKSVSIQALVSGDARLIEAHDKAVSRAVERAEQHAQARYKVGGKVRVENTGNLVVAKFRHETSRERDPQLHTHAVVLNMTRRSDGQWRALRNDEIVKTTKYLGAAYRSELAQELQKLGYELRHDRDGMFELAQMSRDQLEGFSSRSRQIEGVLEKKGLTRETATTAEKQSATMQTRKAKTNEGREVIYQEWRERAKEAGIELSAKPDKSRDYSAQVAISQQVTKEAAQRAVKYALNHLTERQAIVAKGDLIDTAIKHGMGNVTVAHVQDEMKRLKESGYLIQGQTKYKAVSSGRNGEAMTREGWVNSLTDKGVAPENAKQRVSEGIASGGLEAVEAQFTTQTAVQRERSILKIEREGRGSVAPILSKEIVADRFEGSTLKPGQRDAAELILITDNRMVGVQGSAGTGKTYMLKTVEAELLRAGYELKALAPYGSQVKALRGEGIAAKTVASFVRAKDKEISDKTVLVIDEAGVVPARQMQQVLKLAEKSGARIVLVGDKEQTKAIEAGRPFDQLQAKGMKTAVMGDIQRQKDPDLKKAVELAAKGDAKASIQRVYDVVEIANDQERRSTIARDFAALPKEERDNTIILSGTNDARRDINAEIRERLNLSGKGIEFDTLVRRDTTQAERRFARNYHVGDMIQPEKKYASGLLRGELYRVQDTGPGNRLTVQPEKGGESITFNPATHQKISVYRPERAELSIGDQVRITRNDKDLDLANGDRFEVRRVKASQVTLSDGKRRVTLEAGKGKALHVDHAYASTVHAAQGLTVDRVFIDTPTRSRTTAKDVYYVSISRARHHARIYTNDRNTLPTAVAKDNHKHAALDLVRRGHEYQQQRGRTGMQPTHGDLGKENGRQAEQRMELDR